MTAAVVDPAARPPRDAPLDPTTSPSAPGPAVVSRRTAKLLPAVVGLASLLVRLPRLSKPGAFVFDEIFYAPDANDLLRFGIEQGQVKHPPLGKWLIAGGIRIFGFTPFGWRIASVVAGALAAAIIASAALRLTKRWELGALAGVLVSLDGIMFTTSRVAMLDIFVGLFLSATAWFVVAAWEAQPDLARVRRYGIGALLCIGLSAGVKWSAAFTLPIVLGEMLVLERRLAAPGRLRLRGYGRALGLAVLLPAVIYVAAFVPTFVTRSDALPPSQFIKNQEDILGFHEGLKPRNPYAVPAYNWLLQTEPAALYRQICQPAQGPSSPTCPTVDHPTEVRVLAVANPVGWWAAVVAGVVLLGLVAWLARWRALLLLLLGLSQWVPWMLISRPPYSFYETGLIPLMALWVPAVLVELPRRWAAALAGVLGLAVVAMFAFLYPLFTAIPLSVSAAHGRMLRGWP